MQSLSEVKAGAVCTIKMDVRQSHRSWSSCISMTSGREVTINVFQHGRDSMIIGMNNIRLAIGNEVAERIKV